MPSFIPLDHYRTKFYQREKDSKRFLELSEEQLVTLAKKVYIKQELVDNSLPEYARKNENLERYQRTLQYLTSSLVHLELRTFDEKLAYLIMMTDPNLVMFKDFLKIDLMSTEEISKIEDEKERIRLRKIRNQTIASYESSIREKLGFYDVKMLKYEEMFFINFFGERELITEVKNNNQDRLITRTKLLKDFNSISDKRYEELVGVGQIWLSLAPKQFNSKVAAYSVVNQKKLLGLKTLAEQAALFILIVDPELDMLRIYEEECMIKNTERRIIEQFGYYNEELLNLEKKFHSRFCPNKQVSIWSKIKKD